MNEESLPALGTLQIEGMTCAACVRRVEKALERAPGVASARVNLASSTAVIATTGSLEAAAQASSKAGYPARILPKEEKSLAGKRSDEEAQKAGRAFLLAALVTLPVFAVSMAWHHRPDAANWAMLPPSAWVILFSGWRFHAGAWKAARTGAATMDTLISLGSLASLVISLYGLLAHAGHSSGHVYLESGAVIVTLVLLGKWLEARGKAAMSHSVSRLLSLAPSTARLIRPDGSQAVIPSGALKQGQRVLVFPGEAIPVDGIVAEGRSEVDESLVTGEPLPQLRQPGDSVSEGTLNGLSPLTITAERVGEEGTLARMAEFIEKAQASKAPLQKLADRAASVFVPSVIAIALAALGWGLAAGLGWEASLIRMVSALVIACPCALGLATPMALIAGTGRGAELGILTKDAESLERAAKARWMVFDKTGTLTEGHPELTSVEPLPGMSREEALLLAAALESGSEHPLAKAVVKAAQGLAIPQAKDVQVQPGFGICGEVEGRRVTLGQAKGGPSGAAAGSAALLEVDGKPSAWLVWQDVLRPEAGEAMAALRRLGVEPILASGDREEAVQEAARESGISRVHSRMTPEGKAGLVRDLQGSGPVAMAGDGINDAPALALADLGIAMGRGTDIARESAGMVLLRQDLRLIPQALVLARKTVSTIRWNLAWASGYNLVMIPLAFMGHLSPMLASGAMAFSSVSVVLNSLRLRKARLDLPRQS